MVRPKKDPSQPETAERIVDAFWDLLGTQRLDEITVDMIVSRAMCNRGSFYYHFSGINDLANAALDSILTNDENIPGRLFVLSTGSRGVFDVFRGHEKTVGRLSLALSKGAYEMVRRRLISYFEDLWTLVLCPDPSEHLTDDARFVVTYTVGALLGIIERYAVSINESSALEALFISEAGGVTLRNLSAAQGIPIETMIEQLHAVKRIERMQPQRKGKPRPANKRD